MSVILSWILQYLVLPVLLMLIKTEESAIIVWVQSKISQYEQRKVNAQNAATEEAAAKSGDHDAMAKAEQDLLNGTKPTDPN